MDRVFAPLRPCVPVLDPLGAASWQLAPLMQGCLAVHPGIVPHRSVGFIRLSPYWQYVTVWRGNDWTTGNLRNMPRGFSIIKPNLGLNVLISASVCSTNSSPSMAFALRGLGIPSMICQYLPMEATLKVVHGGLAQMKSKLPNKDTSRANTSR